MKKFNLVFSSVVLLLLLYIYGLSLFGYYLSLTTIPSIYVLQIDYNGVDDRIVKTVKSLDNFETIYTNPSIIDFAASSKDMLVTTGELNKNTTLTHIQLKNNSEKTIEIGNKYITNMHSANQQFVIEYDELKSDEESRDYITLLGVVDTNNSTIEELNPDLLATGVSGVYINPIGTKLAFNGVANKQYMINLNDKNKVSIINSPSDQSTGFIGENSLGYITNNYDENAKLVLLNTNTNQQTTIDLNIKYASEVLATENLDTIYISQLEKTNNTNFIKSETADSTLVYLSNKQFSNLRLNKNNDYLLTQKTTNGLKNFAIFNTKSMTIFSSNIGGEKAVWVQ
jgi:hypothetical protein